ncbi:MAG: proprotein convertase P-domain-containing protein [Bryobacterales bacterium]|nr:proprotein convertase P-domain-containing protein [Bryobacterales bacterium]
MASRILFGISFFMLTWPVAAQLTGNPAFDKVRRLHFLRDESFVANGVDTGTGSFSMDIPVMQVEGGRQLSFQLRYNSVLRGGGGPFSPGWSHNFEQSLSPGITSPIAPTPLRVNLDANRRIEFSQSGSTFSSQDEAGRFDTLVLRTPNAGWRYTRRDGTEMDFDTSGRTTEERNKVRQAIRYGYADNRLSTLTEPIANRFATLEYRGASSRLQSILDQAGRVAFFGYDSNGQLASVHPPAKLSEPMNLQLVDVSIPDNSQTGVTRSFNISGRAAVGIVRIAPGSISHPRPSDIRVTIISPQGTELNLGFTNIGTSINLSGLSFDSFWGENPNGTWRIVVRDLVAGSTGSLSPVGLRFTDKTSPTRFEYDSAGRLSTVRDADGVRMLTNVYDSLGRIVQQDDANPNNLPATFQYQEGPTGVVTTYQDRLGHEWEFRHDAGHHLLSLTNPLNQTTRFSYDSSGNRVSVTDALSRITRFTHDQEGNLLSVTDPANSVWQFQHTSFDGNLTRISDPLGQETTFEYDGNSNLRAVRDALGNRDTKSYNGNSQLTGSLMQDGGGINFTYSGGKPVGVSHASGRGMGGEANYDTIGLPSSLRDGDGFETKLEYDDQGREVKKTNPLGDSETFEYDVRGRVSRHRDFNGNLTTYTYDGNDNLIELTDALGRKVRYAYDGEDNLVTTTAPNGGQSQMVYDAAGRVIEEQDPLGNKLTFAYDAVGNRIEEYDANGKLLVRTRYNALDFPIQMEDADGNIVATEFDAVGQPVRFVNALGQPLAITYDSIGRPVTARDALNRQAARTFEQDDMVRSLVDAKNVTQLTFTYDPANRMTGAETRSGSHRWTYNDRDLVTRYTMPAGQQFNYTYDSGGRPTTIAPGGTGAANGRTLTYTYDKNGNPLQVRRQGSDGTATLTRQFDALDRVTRYTDERGNVLQYLYDASGNVATIRYPNGREVNYIYDVANRLEEIRDWAGRRTRYHYDSNSRISRIDFPNGTSRVMRYDVRGNIVRRQDRNHTGNLIVDYRYTYGRTGLLDVASPGMAESAATPINVNFTYNNQNQIDSYLNQPVTHDQNGRMTRGPVGQSVQNLAYSFGGNLTNAGPVVHSYDAEDRLTRITDGTRVSDLIVNPAGDFSQVLIKRDSGSGPTGDTYYVWGVGLAYEVGPSGDIRVYHYDQRGSVVAFSNGMGDVTGRVAYGPYGEVTGRSGNTDSLFLFQGLFGILTTPGELNLMGARWYSPAAKRFLSEDPYFGEIERIGTLNRYAYAGADPINRFDPSGKFWQLLGAAVGAVVGIAVQATSDLISGKFSGWKAYAGAAIGGAVGGLVAATTGCFACAGAAASATEYLVNKGLNGEPVDPLELAVVTGVGAIAGKVGSKAGKVLGPASRRAGKAMAKAVGKNAARPVAQRFSRKALQKALAREATKDKIRKAISAASEDFFVGLAVNQFAQPLALSLLSSPPTASVRPPLPVEGGNEGMERLNRNRVKAYGEFLHWNYYMEALQLSAVPVPNNPNNLLTSF